MSNNMKLEVQREKNVLFDENSKWQDLYKPTISEYIIVKPWPQTLSPQTQKPKTKGPWADTKISWATTQPPPHNF